MKRREFVIGCSAALIATGIAPVILKAATPDTVFTGIPALSSERFKQLVGSNFNVYTKDWSIVRMQLLKVEDQRPSAQLDQFQLSFQTSPNTALQEGLYLVNHEQDGDLHLFLSPDEEQPNTYNAFFSLLR